MLRQGPDVGSSHHRRRGCAVPPCCLLTAFCPPAAIPRDQFTGRWGCKGQVLRIPLFQDSASKAAYTGLLQCSSQAYLFLFCKLGLLLCEPFLVACLNCRTTSSGQFKSSLHCSVCVKFWSTRHQLCAPCVCVYSTYV